MPSRVQQTAVQTDHLRRILGTLWVAEHVCSRTVQLIARLNARLIAQLIALLDHCASLLILFCLDRRAFRYIRHIFQPKLQAKSGRRSHDEHVADLVAPLRPTLRSGQLN